MKSGDDFVTNDMFERFSTHFQFGTPFIFIDLTINEV